jgi:hypothetical protein
MNAGQPIAIRGALEPILTAVHGPLQEAAFVTKAALSCPQLSETDMGALGFGAVFDDPDLTPLTVNQKPHSRIGNSSDLLRDTNGGARQKTLGRPQLFHDREMVGLDDWDQRSGK